MVDRTFRAGEKLERVTTETRTMQYLYRDGDELHLMDNESYEQMAVPAASVDNDDLLAPNTDVQVLFVRERPIRIELPTFVELAGRAHRPGREGRHGLERDQAGRARDAARRSTCRCS